MKHGASKFNRKVKTAPKAKKAQVKHWISAYLSCLFEDRPVEVLPKHQRELDLLLW